MTHDIEDLLELITMLEERILKLEQRGSTQKLVQHDDAWYWEHG